MPPNLLVLSWTVDKPTASVGFQLKGKTNGYVALGFDAGNGMCGADGVFGWVNNGLATLSANYVNCSRRSQGLHLRDREVLIVRMRTGKAADDTKAGKKGNYYLFGTGGEEADGFTTIRFHRQLVTGRPNDQPVRAGSLFAF